MNATDFILLHVAMICLSMGSVQCFLHREPAFEQINPHKHPHSTFMSEASSAEVPNRLNSLFRTLYIPKLKHEDEPQNTWNSQVHQDALVAYLLGCKRNGYFVDLAANDAITISNTFALERFLNWNGICWEANPHYWYRLATKRSCVVIGGAATGSTGEEVEFVFGGGLGGIQTTEEYQTDVTFETLQRNFKKNHGRIGTYGKPGEAPEQEKVPTSTLNEVLELFAPERIDYLSLDVEGAEWIVMQNFNFTKHRFAIMTIERPKEQLMNLLHQYGYQEHPQRVSMNRFRETLWIAEDFPNRQEILATPMHVLIEKALKNTPLDCKSSL